MPDPVLIDKLIDSTNDLIRLLKISNWCREKSNVEENLFVKRLRDNGLSNREIDDICLNCFDSNHPCHCKNGD